MTNNEKLSIINEFTALMIEESYNAPSKEERIIFDRAKKQSDIAWNKIVEKMDDRAVIKDKISMNIKNRGNTK